ncbi:MAG TPA: nuclear transport factor 2 family protein [Terriglobales bacterium]|nr:nuclear transport factor 2 family protein [Terriglobales bacterium]
MTITTIDAARGFAESWIAAWNAHDLEAILAHYDDAASSSSRVAARLLGNPEVNGKAALRAYFQRGLEAHPDLAFQLNDVLVGVASIVICFTTSGHRNAEVLEMSAAGKITRVWAHQSA